jgi:hypothetical protein
MLGNKNSELLYSVGVRCNKEICHVKARDTFGSKIKQHFQISLADVVGGTQYHLYQRDFIIHQPALISALHLSLTFITLFHGSS